MGEAFLKGLGGGLTGLTQPKEMETNGAPISPFLQALGFHQNQQEATRLASMDQFNQTLALQKAQLDSLNEYRQGVLKYKGTKGGGKSGGGGVTNLLIPSQEDLDQILGGG